MANFLTPLWTYRGFILGSIKREFQSKYCNSLQETSNMTIKEIEEHLGIGRRAVEKQIEKLKREGRLQRIGPDNSGHRQVQKVDQ